MALFLADDERDALLTDPQLREFRWALQRRIDRVTASPGLLTGEETADWWRPVFEYLSEAAWQHAVKPTGTTGPWLRDVTLSLIRRPIDDWVGPAYRDHHTLDDDSQIGHLETAHLTWAVALVLDLAADALAAREREEAAAFLCDRAVPMCLNWLDRAHPVANWWCVMASGVAVAAAVLNDERALTRARRELRECTQVFQDDGSYAESLQYGNYAIYALMLAREALIRRGEDVDQIAPLGRFIGYVRWAAASYLYRRPMTGWGPGPRPRSINFNDSAAVFAPSADVLMHIASRGARSHPLEAGLARWLFDQVYGDTLDQGPFDQASFGLRTNWGFVTPLLLKHAPPARSPEQSGLAGTLAFDCGDSIARDRWDGQTVLAMRGGGAGLNGPGHLHRDLNSILLVHNNQRLLADAGHACYRNTSRQLDMATDMHNTCTFFPADAPDETQLAQSLPPTRRKDGNRIDPPIARPARRLIAARCDDVSLLGGEAAKAYGPPITRFARFAILCGSNVVFIIDRIVADRPVRPQWNWLLNNRDGALDVKPIGSDRVVVRRPNAGMKLICLADASVRQRFAQIHDAYHCMPGQVGEGRPGSGVLLQWRQNQPVTEQIAIHAMVVDGYGAVAGWHLRDHKGFPMWEAAGGTVRWAVQFQPEELHIDEQQSGRQYIAWPDANDSWSLRRAT